LSCPSRADILLTTVDGLGVGIITTGTSSAHIHVMLQLFADGLLFIIQQVLGEEQIATEGKGEGEHTMLGVGTGHPIIVELGVLHATIDGLGVLHVTVDDTLHVTTDGLDVMQVTTELELVTLQVATDGPGGFELVTDCEYTLNSDMSISVNV